jgi:biotin operon repressor
MEAHMKTHSKDPYGSIRLKSKNVKNAIIQKISQDFNLTPIIAEAYFRQISSYFNEHLDIKLSSGQIAYEAVAAEEPPSKHIALAKKVTTALTLNDFNSDLQVLADRGLAGLRRHRILRLTREASDQNAVLSYEDLAVLLTTSPATVKRDIRALRQQGLFIVTRGWKHDMGPGTSHKTQIIDLYLKGYQFTEIEQKTNHSETAVLKYLSHFTQIVQLHTQNFSPGQIRTVTGFSDKLIAEYIELFKQYQHTDNQRLTLLLNPEPREKKGATDEETH